MTLIQAAKLNGVDPLAWLTNGLERIVSGRTKEHEMHTLLPWAWAAAIANSEAEPLAAWLVQPVNLNRTCRSRTAYPEQGGRHRQNGGRVKIGTVGAITSEHWAA